MILNNTDEYVIEHYGKVGMKWGERKAKAQVKRTDRLQGQVDRHRRVAAGGGSKRDKAAVALNTPLYRLAKGKGLQGGAQLSLIAAHKQQQKIINGEKKVQDLMLRKVYGIDIRDLNYSSIKRKKS